mgnify:CR=1 FL=1
MTPPEKQADVPGIERSVALIKPPVAVSTMLRVSCASRSAKRGVGGGVRTDSALD